MKSKSNVIGPFTLTDWTVLGMLRASIKQYKAINYTKYKDAIDQETTIFRNKVRKVA